MSTSPSSWISLQISCSSIYFNLKKSYLFSNYILIKSGRCLTSLVLRDIASMNEAFGKKFYRFFNILLSQNCQCQILIIHKQK